MAELGLCTLITQTRGKTLKKMCFNAKVTIPLILRQASHDFENHS